MKTSELIGTELDWAVAKCKGFETNLFRGVVVEPSNGMFGALPKKWRPSSNWEQGGPIIEREKIEMAEYKGGWSAHIKTDAEPLDELHGYGPTPLIAAMRCYVASKLGDEVEIPEELK